MIFSDISKKIQNAFNDLSKKTKVDEKDIVGFLDEINQILLEADVSLSVVKKIIEEFKIEWKNYQFLDSLSKKQNLINVLRKILVQHMGDDSSDIEFSEDGLTVILMIGLQGSGKTTTSAKIAAYLKDQGKDVVLSSVDVTRPAAIDQLKILSEKINVPMFIKYDSEDNYSLDVLKICKEAKEKAEAEKKEVLIIDTAGRLQIDQKLMNELKSVKTSVNPNYIFLVIDSMIGQEANNVASKFNEELNVNGIILTKLDGDARGGAALSVKDATGVPIKFFGDGEKIDNFQAFHAERMVDRMLGMGDILTLIEKAEKAFKDEEAKKMEESLMKGEFTFDDLSYALKNISKIGSMDQILGMLPQMGNIIKTNQEQSKSSTDRVVAIINSMTKEERKGGVVLTYKRKVRIAKGSGTSVNDVDKLIKQREQTNKMMKTFTDMTQSMGSGNFEGLGGVFKNLKKKGSLPNQLDGGFGDIFKMFDKFKKDE